MTLSRRTLTCWLSERRIEEGDRQAGGHRDMVCINKLRKVYGNKKVRREGRGERGRQRREGESREGPTGTKLEEGGVGAALSSQGRTVSGCLCDAPLLV